MSGIVIRRKKKQKKIYKYLSVLLVGAGILSLGYPFMKDSLVSYVAESKIKEIQADHQEAQGNREIPQPKDDHAVSEEEKKEKGLQQEQGKNKTGQSKNQSGTIEKVTYNFEDVTPITMKDIVQAASKKMSVVATIKVPSVKINLPIMEGVSNSAMSVGAGTLKPNQDIGKGNYAMASHHMNNPKLLFSPLDRVKKGASLYLSNGQETYEYVVVEKRIIDAREIDVIEDKEGKNLVTLITCNADGKKRLMVVGELKS
ncbi:class A sortase [Bacillus paramycoides]|uniref:class A sortase n=1 Tax=Bacillus paramycoides TaxID=2026194 RepID=UPI0015BDCFBC|nr:class A sortase [Bacillus paramycoides]NWK72623.1 class A sortase [Bacillus paramycoides]